MKSPQGISPQDLFRVSGRVSYLEPIQLERLERCFMGWKDDARRSDSVLSRTRLWLVFLLLRHTGARLGEVLALDDTTAFDAERCLVRLGRDDRERGVPLPTEFYSVVQSVLESPMGCGFRGTFFHLDPGYFRRICYARGKDCELPKELVGPNALRNTRAVEMLRSGVPLAVVRQLLGQSSSDIAASLQQFSPQEVHSIVNSAHEAMRRRTSARNSFVGNVVSIAQDAVMAEVVLETRSGETVCAVITTDSLRNLDLREGTPVVASIKAPLVNVVRREGVVRGSARNRFKATIIRVAETPALAEILGRLPDGTDICALVSAQSVRELELSSGDEAEFWFKALSVILNSVQI